MPISQSAKITFVRISTVLLSVLFAFLISRTAYVKSLSPEDQWLFQRGSFLLVFALVFFGIWFLWCLVDKDLKQDEPLKEIGVTIGYIAATSAPVLVAYVIATYGEKILPALNLALGLYGTRFLIFCTVIAFGIGAHSWKQRDQKTYGLGEMIFAITATGFIAFRIVPGQSLLSQWVALGGSAYVVARGMNNFTEAKEKKKKSALRLRDAHLSSR